MSATGDAGERQEAALATDYMEDDDGVTRMIP